MREGWTGEDRMRDEGPELAPSGHPAPGAPRRLTRRAALALGAAAALTACAPSGEPAAVSSAGAGRPTGDAAAPDASSTSPTSSTSASSGPRSSGPASPAAVAGAPAVEIVHGSRTTPAVALTFHGAGDPRLAQGVLDAVARGGAHITVLAVGTWLQAYPQLGTTLLAGGHELGNHTWHHRPMRQMSESSAYDEIVGGQKQVARFTRAPTWFRPSGTPRATANILAAAGRAGYRTSLAFDVDPRDYADPGPAAVVSRVLADVRAGSIVSLHLGHAGTVAALPRILAGLASRGLSTVTVSQLLKGAHP
jgi:peptidoglycan/xylan/chitin deacetylase (PgdA/CDA1 family)